MRIEALTLNILSGLFSFKSSKTIKRKFKNSTNYDNVAIEVAFQCISHAALNELSSFLVIRKSNNTSQLSTGSYTKATKLPSNTRNKPSEPKARSLSKLSIMNSGDLLTMATNYFWTAYSMIMGNYLAVATVVIVVVLSYLIPDISSKIHANNELKNMKKVLDIMATEVDRAEAACLTVADEVCCLHCAMQDDATETTKDVRDLSVCTSHSLPATKSEPVQIKQTKVGFFRRVFFPNRNASHKEIAIMSYLYTNSFDAKKNDSRTKQVIC